MGNFKKLIFGFIGAAAALTMFSSAVSANVIDNVGGAANEAAHGIGDAVEGVVEGAEGVVENITGNANNHVNDNNVHDHDNDGIPNHKDNDLVGKEGHLIGEETHGIIVTEGPKNTEEIVHGETATAEDESVKNVVDRNPATSVELVTFGAMALGSMAVVATTRKKR